MALSKRVRYEILRRDNHACRYCGARAPEIPLTVDHIVPVALGGTDAPSNLVTACRDCNGGKSSVAPDSPIVADIDMRAMAWARAMERAAEERAAESEQLNALCDKFRESWDSWHWTDRQGDQHGIAIPVGWRGSIRQFIGAGLDVTDLLELLDVAMTARTTDEWRYFCGCCWRRIQQAQERAMEILEADAHHRKALERELVELRAERAAAMRRTGEAGGGDGA